MSVTYDQTSANGHALAYAMGRPTTACAGSICTYYSYDKMGRIQDLWQMAGSGGVHYDYNAAGLATHYTNGVGVGFDQAFNAAGQVTKLTSSLNDAAHPAVLANNLGYGPTGALTSIQYGVQGDAGNGLVETRSYNSLLQPSSYAVTNPTNSSNVLGQTFSFASNGNLLAYQANGNQSFSRVYSYDHLNRLTGMTGDCNLNWTYDAWGNRLNQSVTSGPCTGGGGNGSVNTRNQLGGFSYDVAGNMTAVPNGTSNVSVTYDAENRVVWVGPANTSGSVHYTYDAAGQRVKKETVGGGTTNYVFDATGHVVAETDANGGWNAGYVYLNGKLEAVYRDGTTYFVHGDHLGSTRLWTGVNRSVQRNLDYQPFGEALNRGQSNDFQFTGQEHDSESNTEHFLYREYSSNIGRWTNPIRQDWRLSILEILRHGIATPTCSTIQCRSGMKKGWIVSTTKAAGITGL